MEPILWNTGMNISILYDNIIFTCSDFLSTCWNQRRRWRPLWWECFRLYLLSFCWQMSPASRDLHFEYLLLTCEKVRRSPSTASSIDVFLLISRSLLQSHMNPPGFTMGSPQDWVLKWWLGKANKHLDDATHISMPSLVQTHCWDSESRPHSFNRTSPVDPKSCRHKFFWVL